MEQIDSELEKIEEDLLEANGLIVRLIALENAYGPMKAMLLESLIDDAKKYMEQEQ